MLHELFLIGTCGNALLSKCVAAYRGVEWRNADGLATTCGKESGSFWTHYMSYGSIVKARWVVTQEGLGGSSAQTPGVAFKVTTTHPYHRNTHSPVERNDLL
jgi:hypothetical protein